MRCRLSPPWVLLTLVHASVGEHSVTEWAWLDLWRDRKKQTNKISLWFSVPTVQNKAAWFRGRVRIRSYRKHLYISTKWQA